MGYPAAPWELRGQMYVSIWALPVAQIPALPGALAAVVRPLSIGGRGLVGTAWVRYEPGGVLQYNELLSAVLVRHRGRPRVSIVDIWVDSRASRDGGRELWGIPKELAELEIGAPDGDGLEIGAPDGDGLEVGAPDGDGLAARAWTGADAIAQAAISPGLRYPGRWPTRFSVVQLLRGQATVTPVRGSGSLQRATATWRLEPSGRLAALSGRQPLLTVALRDFRILFGRSR